MKCKHDFRFLKFLKNSKKYTIISFYCIRCMVISLKWCDLSLHTAVEEMEKNFGKKWKLYKKWKVYKKL